MQKDKLLWEDKQISWKLQRKVILLEAKNYDVFIEYKTLYKEEKNIIRSNERAIL